MLTMAEGLEGSHREQLSAFAAVLAKARELHDRAVADLGEIPEHFIDPLLCSLMEDPVKLPSGTTVDRKTLNQLLLGDKIDPFSRQPLSGDEVAEDAELKAEIESWIAASRLPAAGST